MVPTGKELFMLTETSCELALAPPPRTLVPGGQFAAALLSTPAGLAVLAEATCV